MRDTSIWILTLIAAALFALSWTLKLAGAGEQVQLFAAIGLGQWFRYVTGALEAGGAIGLLVPAVAPFAALVLGAVMIGAVLTHLFIVGGNPAMAILLLAIVTTIAYLRREQFRSLAMA